jgi:hypothetical protein
MSQVTQTAVCTTVLLDIKCPRDINNKLKRISLEKGITLQEVYLEAFKEHLARNEALYEKEIVITK